ncbi:MAG: hypothetical protein EPN45_17985 [Rhizobiaceae bacterium]|nr:MAG: hypothetical protein EPN45_17985 [Rhizobiaceae bacterium]
MSTVLQTLLTLIQNLLPQIGVNSKIVTTILTALIQLVPIVIHEASDILPAIKNIIAALSASPAATADQLAALKALDAQVDAAFEAQVAAYLANHPVPATTMNPQQPAA